jgi:hypothetical protein
MIASMGATDSATPGPEHPRCARPRRMATAFSVRLRTLSDVSQSSANPRSAGFR